MGKRMDTKIVKSGFERLSKQISLNLPALGWYFTDKLPPEATFPKIKGPKGCIFIKIKKLLKSGNLCFSRKNKGCLVHLASLNRFDGRNQRDSRHYSDVEFKKVNKIVQYDMI